MCIRIIIVVDDANATCHAHLFRGSSALGPGVHQIGHAQIGVQQYEQRIIHNAHSSGIRKGCLPRGQIFCLNLHIARNLNVTAKGSDGIVILLTIVHSHGNTRILAVQLVTMAVGELVLEGLHIHADAADGLRINI